MLRLEDCLALCDLSEAEVLAIAHHEGLPEMAAVELGRRARAATAGASSPSGSCCANSCCAIRPVTSVFPREIDQQE